MDSKTRQAKLDELKKNAENQAMTGIPLRYKGETKPQIVWRIPLEYLVYNQYNGRIGSSVLSYEKENTKLNPEIEADKKIIEKFLYSSKEDRNKITMKSLKEIGQQQYGIVTADGVIIDGNRRAMLLNKLYHERESLGYKPSEVEHCQYFLAIILPDGASEKDIQQLETMYQMGVDDKLDYNPIEKYLKCKELQRLGFKEEAIAEFMNEKPKQIKKWLSILALMENYLEEYGYGGIYTRLDNTEGQFVDLEGYLDSYQNKSAKGIEWEYDEIDVDALKRVCFDYIRARYEGKDFREIAKTGKGGSIFSHESLWKGFLEQHLANTPGDEESIEKMRERCPNEGLSTLLKQRDNEWTNNSIESLTENFDKFSGKLRDIRAANKPGDLVERALSALQNVDYKQDNFSADSRIPQMVEDIEKIIGEMKKQLKPN